jgi:hypothetical protein
MNRKPLAVAIALAMGASSASAINIETTGGTDVPNELFSSEFQGGVGQVELPPIVVDIDAGLSVGDLITITFNSGITASGVTTAFNYAGALPTLVSEGGNTNGAVAFRTAAADGSSVTYRVTSTPKNTGVDEVGGLLTMPVAGLFSRSGANVTVSASVTDGLTGDSLEASTTPDTILTNSGSQFRFAVTNLSETIDVNTGRLRFNTGAATSATHTIGYSIVTNAATIPGATTGTITHSATLGTTALTITGDFSWLDSSSTTTGIQSTNTALVAAGGGANAAGGVLTVNTSGALAGVIDATPGALGVITLGNATTTVIPEQTLTLTSSLRYTTTGSSGAISGTSTGAYDLNGSSVTVYSVPTNASNFIWLTNTGSTNGAAISASIDDAGTVTNLGELGVTADSNDQVDVWPAVLAAAAAAGVELTNPGRVNLTLVTEAPATDVVVSGVYRVGDDRVNLISSLDTDIAD